MTKPVLYSYRYPRDYTQPSKAESREQTTKMVEKFLRSKKNRHRINRRKAA